MSKQLILFLFLLPLFSCNNKENEKIPIVLQGKNVNSLLIHFGVEGGKSIDLYDKSQPELYSIQNVKIKYVDDFIFVTANMNSNECDDFFGNVYFENNHLTLIIKNLHKEPCLSYDKSKIVYIIRNPENKKYKIKFEMEK